MYVKISKPEPFQTIRTVSGTGYSILNQPVFLRLHHHCLVENVQADLPWKNVKQKRSIRKPWGQAVVISGVLGVHTDGRN